MNKKLLLNLLVMLVIAGAGVCMYFFTPWFHKNDRYFGYFSNIKGLQLGAPIFMKGVRVGKISDIELNQERLRVVFAIRKEIKIPKGSVAQIAAADVSGTKSIWMIPGVSSHFILPGEEIKTAMDTTLAEDFEIKITPILNDATSLLKQTHAGFSEINSLMRGGLGAESKTDIKLFTDKLEALKKRSAHFKEEVSLNGTIYQIETATKNPSDINSDVNQKVSSAEQKTNKLSGNNISHNLQTLQTHLSELKQTMQQMQAPESSFGKELQTPSSYNRINLKLDTINRSMQQTQQSPSGFSIFGGGKKK